MPDCPSVDGLVVEGDCSLEQGTELRFIAPEPPPTPTQTPSKRRQRAPVPEVPPVAEQPSAAEPAPPAAPVSPAPADTHTSTVAAGTSGDELSSVMASAGGGGTGIVAALILVAGGTAGWKFWSQLSTQKHEQAMKDRELAAQEKGLGSAQPIPCQNVAKVHSEAIAKLTEAVAELQTKVSKVEKKTASVSADFDGEEMEERLKKAESAIRSIKKSLADA